MGNLLHDYIISTLGIVDNSENVKNMIKDAICYHIYRYSSDLSIHSNISSTSIDHNTIRTIRIHREMLEVVFVYIVRINEDTKY